MKVYKKITQSKQKHPMAHNAKLVEIATGRVIQTGEELDLTLDPIKYKRYYLAIIWVNELKEYLLVTVDSDAHVLQYYPRELEATNKYQIIELPTVGTKNG